MWEGRVECSFSQQLTDTKQTVGEVVKGVSCLGAAAQAQAIPLGPEKQQRKR